MSVQLSCFKCRERRTYDNQTIAMEHINNCSGKKVEKKQKELLEQQGLDFEDISDIR